MAIFLLAACTQVADTGSKDEMAQQSIEVVEKLVQAYENEDIEALKEIYSVDLESHGPMYGDIWPYDSILASNAAWFGMADSITFDIDYIMYEKVEEGELEGDWVLLWSDISWVDANTGKSYIIDYHSPHQIVDGKIVYEHAYWNQWDMLQQMGAELKWPEIED